ncbi:hypothetical protein [Streptomyces sp. NPDC003015]
MMAQTLKTSGDTASQPETRQRADHTVTETAREHVEASGPVVNVHAADLNGETPVAVCDSLTRYDLAIDFSRPAEDIAPALQTVLRDGVDSGRWARVDNRLTPVEAAEQAIGRAVLGSLAGLATNPHDVADRLTAAIENAQAEHLARPEVGGFPVGEAQGHEAFHTAVVAMARALALSGNRTLTADGLRASLDMAIAEARA